MTSQEQWYVAYNCLGFLALSVRNMRFINQYLEIIPVALAGYLRLIVSTGRTTYKVMIKWSSMTSSVALQNLKIMLCLVYFGLKLVSRAHGFKFVFIPSFVTRSLIIRECRCWVYYFTLFLIFPFIFNFKDISNKCSYWKFFVCMHICDGYELVVLCC